MWKLDPKINGKCVASFVIWWSIKNVSFLKKSESTYLDQVKWGCAVADNKLISSPINLLVLWAIATHFNFHSSHLSNSSYCTKKSSRHELCPVKKDQFGCSPNLLLLLRGFSKYRPPWVVPRSSSRSDSW